MKQPGQPPNWGRQQQQRQQQQRMQQQMQQQRRRAAGYAWQKQREQKQQAARMKAQQQAAQQDHGLDWQEPSPYAAGPQVQQRSCLGRLVRTVGILIAIGVCLLIAYMILSSL
jgi:hypothetical protein